MYKNQTEKRIKETKEIDGNVADQFNTYELKWTPDEVKWSMNGEKVRVNNNKDYIP